MPDTSATLKAAFPSAGAPPSVRVSGETPGPHGDPNGSTRAPAGGARSKSTGLPGSGPASIVQVAGPGQTWTLLSQGWAEPPSTTASKAFRMTRASVAPGGRTGVIERRCGGAKETLSEGWPDSSVRTSRTSAV